MAVLSGLLIKRKDAFIIQTIREIRVKFVLEDKTIDNSILEEYTNKEVILTGKRHGNYIFCTNVQTK